jgi:zinc transport system permease protein
MIDFLKALSNPDIPFLRFAVVAGMLSSAAFGIIGSYVVVKRITSIAGSIAHSVLAGIGFSLFLEGRYGIEWFPPILGALAAALISALIIGLVTMYGRQREDTIIGSVWAVGMALGIMFISLTPSYVEPMSYLFGNILMVSKRELIFIAVLDGLVIILGILLYNKFLAVSFDEEFAQARGVNTLLYTLLLLLLTALTIVLLTTIVGIIMVIALLTLPAAVASLFAKNLWKLMLFAVVLTMVFTFFGTALSYTLDTPSGSTIILFAGALYILAIIVKKVVQAVRKRRKPSLC